MLLARRNFAPLRIGSIPRLGFAKGSRDEPVFLTRDPHDIALLLQVFDRVREEQLPVDYLPLRTSLCRTRRQMTEIAAALRTEDLAVMVTGHGGTAEEGRWIAISHVLRAAASIGPLSLTERKFSILNDVSFIGNLPFGRYCSDRVVSPSDLQSASNPLLLSNFKTRAFSLTV